MSWLNENFLWYSLIIQTVVTILILIMAFKSHIVVKRSNALLKKNRRSLPQVYKNSNFSRNLMNKLVKRLIYLMESQKPYKDGNFSLSDLSSQLGAPEKQVSELINQKFGQDFITFINTYRITEAIRILRTGSLFDIRDVPIEVGFDNMRSFDKAFKEYTNTTPEEFVADNIAMMDVGFS